MLISECAETNGTGKLSPDGKKAVLSKSLSVKLYELSQNMKFLYRWAVPDEVTSIQWSRDGSIFMCVLKKRGIVQVFSTQDYNWTCQINPGLIGIVSGLISNDNRNIATVGRNETRLSVWNLITGQVENLKNLKFGKKGFCFSYNGEILALIIRENSSDAVSFIRCHDWKVIKIQKISFMASDLFFFNDSSGVVVWGEKFENTFCVMGLNGEVLYQYEGSAEKPGIEKVVFNKSYMAVCCLDYKLRVFHLGSWVMFHEFSYELNRKTIVCKESEEFRTDDINENDLEYINTAKQSVSETCFCVINESSKLIATVLKALPHIIWLWDCGNSELLSIITLKKSVKCLSWAGHLLAWVCGDPYLYLWSQNNEVTACSSSDINTSKLEYRNGSFLLQNKLLAVYCKLN